MKKHGAAQDNPKQTQLEGSRVEPGERLTTTQGVAISDNQNSLRAGIRGPTLLEDFVFREKMMHFDHERIPERIVHARGSAAYGWFQPYESLSELTAAKFLQDPSIKTPVFVRFSTTGGRSTTNPIPWGAGARCSQPRGCARLRATQRGSTAPRCGRAARASASTTARPRCSGTA